MKYGDYIYVSRTGGLCIGYDHNTACIKDWEIAFRTW